MSDDPRPHIRDMAPAGVLERLSALGAPGTHGRRILAWVVLRDHDELAALRGIPAATRRAVQDSFRFDRLTLVESVRDDTDGSVKHLFRCPDGALQEAVWIPLKDPATATVCLSSQVGCSLDCDFCATGRLGLRRNLRTWEMVDAFLQVRARSARRVSGAVFMGQGEPFLNYEAVLAAADLLRHPCGGSISGKAITISTAGVVPAIRRFTAEGHPYRLIVSLTSTDPERRAALMPKASRWPLDELVDAIREYARVRRDRVTVAWVNLSGVNMGADEVEGLRRLFEGTPLRLNLIDVNADPRRPSARELDAFYDQLRGLGVPLVARYTVGRERNGACGMLASTRWPSEERATPAAAPPAPPEPAPAGNGTRWH